MELQARALVIDPAPTATTVNAASVDLHLDSRVQRYKPNPGGLKLDLRDANATAMLAYATDWIDIGSTEFWLKKGDFVIGYTKEKVILPAHLLARVEGRSSFARFGISIHNTAPTILPGFAGPIALELTNVGPVDLQLTPGLIICQLVLESLGRPAVKPYAGQFQNQSADPEVR